MNDSSPQLPIARFRFVFTARDRVALPDYAGSAWRGAFGHALRKAVCVTRMKTCEACLLRHTCAYAYVFETPPPPAAEKMTKYSHVPHPFLLEPDISARRLSSGDNYILGFSSVGHAARYLPYVIHALGTAAERGVGKGAGRMALTEVRQERTPGSGDWCSIYRPGGVPEPFAPCSPEAPPMPPSLTIRLHTPLRLKRDGKLVTPDAFTFSDLAVSLLRRVSMLSFFHTDTPLETDFAGLAHKARAARIGQARLEWKDWTRYSSRQQAEMQMGGLVGEFELDLGGLEVFWPYLWLGSFVHAGAVTSMGLGRYTIEPASLPDASFAPLAEENASA